MSGGSLVGEESLCTASIWEHAEYTLDGRGAILESQILTAQITVHYKAFVCTLSDLLL